jgi:peptidoglycan/xylan/chitin deacetylase (PgdA/CDA1 family)
MYRVLRDVINRRKDCSVRILSGHRVIRGTGALSARDRQDLSRGCLSLLEFMERVQHLRENYAMARLEDCVETVGKGARVPRNSVVLTFDDGFVDIYTSVYPVARAESLPITVFLTTGWIGGAPHMLGVGEVREMAANLRGLITWGAHGVTHRPLTDMPLAEAEQEIVRSKLEVEALVGSPVTLFSYPDGKYNDDIKTLLTKHGFVGACATGRALNTPPIDLLALKRIPFEGERLDRFAFRIAGKL